VNNLNRQSLHRREDSMPQIQQGNPPDTPESFVDLLITLPVFGGFTRSELRLAVKYMSYLPVEPEDYIFKEGEQGTYLCFVADGLFEVLKESKKGITMRISTLQKGDSVGEMAVIDNYPRSATVRAKSKGTLITLTRDRFDLLLDQHPHIGIKLLRGIARLLCSNLRKTSRAVVDQLLL
jgi:CRP/FNR family cyclic AMP-dependent transcriptional regulator